MRIDVQKTHPVSIAYAHAYEDGHTLLVEGHAKFPEWKRFGIFHGHVDVTLLKPDGETVRHRDVELIPLRIPKSYGREAYFETRFPTVPPRGTTVHVAYRD